jgi:hypothetical protein
MFKWIVSIVAVAALAVPAASLAADNPAAPAKGTQVDGSAVALQGRLLLRADLSASAGAQPVHLVARMGVVRFVDLGGDMNAQCTGKGPDRTRQNKAGNTVVLCAGRGRATVTGSHFRIVGLALRYGIAIPDGYTGTVKGRARPWDGNDDSIAQGTGDDSSAPSSPQSDGQKAVSTIDAALAAALAKKN